MEKMTDAQVASAFKQIIAHLGQADILPDGDVGLVHMRPKKFSQAPKSILPNAPLQSYTYAAGEKKVVALDQSGMVHGFLVVFDGAFLAPTPATTAVPRTFGVAECIEYFEISLNNGKQTHKLSGLEAYLEAAWQSDGQFGELTQATTTQARADGTSTPIRAAFEINLNHPGMFAEEFGCVPANRLLSWQMVIKAPADPNAAMSDTPDTGGVVSGTVYIYPRFVETDDSVLRGFGLVRRTVIEDSVTANTTLRPQKFTPGIKMERLTFVTKAGSALDLSDSVLSDDIIIKQGGVIKFQMKVADLRTLNKKWWGAQVGVLVLDFNRLNKEQATKNIFQFLDTKANGGDVILYYGIQAVSGNSLHIVVTEQLGVTEAAQLMGLPQIG